MLAHDSALRGTLSQPRHVLRAGSAPRGLLARQPFHPARTGAAHALAAEQRNKIEFGASMSQGPRPNMEDQLRLVPDAKLGATVAIVFDGHGGEDSANWLQEELHKDVIARLEKNFLATDAAGDPVPGKPFLSKPRLASKVLTDVFHSVDDRLCNRLRAEKGMMTGLSGATATVAIVHKDKVIIASIGDSAAVLCRNGNPITLTKAHRLYGNGEGVFEEMDRVEASGAWIMDGRVCNILAVSRAFGDPEFKGEGLRVLLDEGAAKGSWPKDFAASHVFKGDPVIATPEVVEALLLPEDEFLVVATDGLWDAMNPNDATRYARSQFQKGKSAQEVADALVDIAVKRYTSDNVAVVVADLKGTEAWTTKAPKDKSGGGNIFKTIGSTFFGGVGKEPPMHKTAKKRG